MGNALKKFLFMHAIDYIMRVVLLKDFRKIEKKLLLPMHKGFSFANSSIQK